MIVFWRIKSIFSGVFFVLLLSAAGWGTVANTKTADCSKCPELLKDTEALKKDAQISANEFKNEKEKVKNMTVEQDAQKRNMASQLFVLAAKSETAQNYFESKEKEWKLNCSKCGKIQKK